MFPYIAEIMEVHAPGMAKPCIVPLPKNSATTTGVMQPPGTQEATTSARSDAPHSELDAASDTFKDPMEFEMHRTASVSNIGSLDGSFTGSVISQSGMSPCMLHFRVETSSQTIPFRPVCACHHGLCEAQ